MPSPLAACFSRVLLPLVFSLGVIGGCSADEIPSSPLAHGAGGATTPGKATEPGKSKPGGPTSPTGPSSAPTGSPASASTPTLSAIAPDAVTLGTVPAGGVDLTLTGTRFASGAQVDLAGVLLPASVASSTQLTVHVPADKAGVSGVFRIMVVAQPGSTSNPLSFTVANPSSVSITALTPSSAVLGAAAPVTLVLTGAGFVPTSVVKFNGAALATTFTSATQLSATLPANAFLDAGRYGVTVSSGADVVSLPIAFEIQNPAPQTTAITPRTATAGAAALVVTIDGTGFTKASTALASGSPLDTTFVSALQLRAALPASMLATAGTLALVVQSPTPGGGSATAQTFTVSAATSSGSSGSSSGDSSGAACVYRCDDYGYAPGQCFQDWYCIPTGTYAGCLGQSACN